MTNYEVVFITTISAKDKKELGEKAEKIASMFSDKIHKKVTAHAYMNQREHQQTKLW